MKDALGLMLDSNFFCSAFEVFSLNLIKHNPELFNKSLDIYIVDLGLSLQEQRKIKDTFSPATVIFSNPKKFLYEESRKEATKECLVNTFYKLDFFGLVGYRRLVFLDLDCLVLGNVSSLFTRALDNPVGIVNAYNKGLDRLERYGNSGVLILNYAKIKCTDYQDLLQLTYDYAFALPDQDVINKVYAGRMTYLPKIYNAEKRVKGSKFLNYSMQYGFPYLGTYPIKILHFVGQKPWDTDKTNFNRGYEDLEALWKV